MHDYGRHGPAETRFAWNGNVSLAYQVCGDSPTDLVYLQGCCSNVDMNWESPHLLTAARSERASILGTHDSALVASLFAATYPERTRSLILVDPQVTYVPTEDTPWMPSLARWQQQIQAVRDTWGTSEW